MKRNQRLNAVRGNEEKLAEFMSMVMKTDGCWPWIGSAPDSAGGYGFFSLGSHSDRAHRVAYVLMVGELPPGMLVCHSCDNPICVRPSHLFVGTYLDNNRDRDEKGRQTILRGEMHHGAKITAHVAHEIRKRYAAGGVLQRELGAMFGLSQAEVSKIVLRQIWTSV